MKKILIGLTGRTGINSIAGCGKDTVANIISKQTGVPIYGFADPIYDMIKCGFGIDGKSDELQDREKKSARIDWLSNEKDISLRYLLETLGTEWGRNIVNRNLWTLIAEKRYFESSNGLIIRDVRFQNEVEWLNKLNGILVHVIRPDYITQDANPYHISNMILPIGVSDKIILNNSDLKTLEKRVIDFLESV